MKLINKHSILLISLMMISCGGKNIVTSTSHTSSEDSSLVISNSSEETSSIITSSTNETSLQESSSSSSAFLEEANLNLAKASLHDEDFSSITMTHYNVKEKYYQKQSYKMTSYLNNLTIYKGTTTQSDYNSSSISSNYVEQRYYANNKYSQIRKFDSTFQNSANIANLDEQNAKLYLNIGQSLIAYSVLQSFVENYGVGHYYGEYDVNNTYHGTYFSMEGSVSDDGYIFCVALEFKIDASYHLIDLYYSEGYFDAYFCDDITSTRKHGPSAYGGGGYNYVIDRYELEEKIEYTKALPFALEDNFVTSLAFNQATITISKQAANYIDLIDYVEGNISFALTGNEGAPINNLRFTSSNENVATIGDVHYLDFVNVGETLISATDVANNVKTTTTLKVIVTE